MRNLLIAVGGGGGPLNLVLVPLFRTSVVLEEIPSWDE